MLLRLSRPRFVYRERPVSHSGERIAKCANCGEKIRQRQTLGVWRHWVTGLRNCMMAETPAVPAGSEQA